MAEHGILRPGPVSRLPKILIRFLGVPANRPEVSTTAQAGILCASCAHVSFRGSSCTYVLEQLVKCSVQCFSCTSRAVGLRGEGVPSACSPVPRCTGFIGWLVDARNSSSLSAGVQGQTVIVRVAWIGMEIKAVCCRCHGALRFCRGEPRFCK